MSFLIEDRNCHPVKKYLNYMPTISWKYNIFDVLWESTLTTFFVEEFEITQIKQNQN